MKNLLFLILFTTINVSASTNYLIGDAWKTNDLSKTLTPPSTSQTLVGRTSSDVLTGKSLDATPSINTITNIGNSSISSGASIDYSKMAPMSSGQILLGNAGVPTATIITGDLSVGATGTTTLTTVLAAGTYRGGCVYDAKGRATSCAQSTDLTTAVTGTLPAANGGTGAATAAINLVFASPASGSSGAPTFRSIASQDLSTATFIAPTYQRLTSASPAHYTPPTSPRSPVRLKILEVAGGSGGTGSGTTGIGSSLSGDNTLFGNTGAVNSCTGGSPAVGGASAVGGNGGICTQNLGTLIRTQQGNQGANVADSISVGSALVQGGVGGASCLQGGGGGGGGGAAVAGLPARAQTGAGGGGAGTAANVAGNYSGAGGGGGGCIEFQVSGTLAVSYDYTVGAGSSGGGAGTNGAAGGPGGSGIIIIEEDYQ